MSKLSDWLGRHGVPPGDWYSEAKAFARAAMRAAELSADAFLVLICLRLHTMPYQNERATTMYKGDKLPLTPSDICEETGLTRQNVRRALVELEEAGFALRKPIGEGGLHKGNVEIYCWVLPHAHAKKHKVVARDYNLPPRIIALVRLFRVPLPDDFVATPDYKAFVEKAADDYKEAKIVAAGRLKEAFFVGPGAPAYKEERKSLKESTERKTAGASSASSSAGFIDNILPTDERTVKGSPVVEEASEPSVRPSGWHDAKFRKARLRNYLTKSFRQPTPPDDVVLGPLADLITTKALFDHFEEAAKNFVPKKGWKGFLAIARSVVAHHADYAEAGTKTAAAGSGDPESPIVKKLREDREKRKSWPKS